MMNFMFNLQFLAVLFKTIIGGIVGYFTNDLAIQMLFKKKFGMGGVVEKTREEFIENATDLIEEDVVSQKVLKEKIETEAFNTLLHHILNQYLNQQLPAQINSAFKIGDFRKSDQSFDDFIDVLNSDAKPLFKQFLNSCWNVIPVELVLNRQQLEATSNLFFKLLLQHPNINQLLEDLLNVIFQELRTQSPNQYFSFKSYQSLLNYIILQLKKQVYHPSPALSEHLNQTIKSVLNCLQPEQHISMLIDYIYDRKWSDIINTQHFDKLFQEIQENFLVFFSSPVGQQTTLKFSQSLLKTIKKSNNSLFDLVPDQLSAQFESFIYLRLVEVIKAVTIWIEGRRVEIEMMVNQSISDQNIIAKIVFNIGISLAEMFNVVNIIKDYINGKIDIDQLAEQQSKTFVEALKHYSIQDIFKKLETEQVITEKQLAEIFQKTIISLIVSLDSKLFHFFLSDKPDKIVPKAPFTHKIVTLFQDNLPEFIADIVTSNNQLTTSGYRQLKYQLLILYKKSLITLLPKFLPPSWCRFINQSLIKMFEKYQETISVLIVDKIQPEIKNKTFDEIIPFNNQFFGLFHQKLTQFFYDFKSAFLNLGLKDLWSGFGDIKLKPTFINQIQHVISHHFHRFTKGSIKRISKSNLQSLSLKELSTVVENFMGRELKPITRFGAGLGLMAGFGMAILPGIEQLAARFQIDSSYLVFGFAGLVFGLIGWGTNWLALKMIFRPYLPLYILGYTIPLTPGVIAKNKVRFAGKMGEFVQENLLNDSSIEKLFETNQDIIKLSFQKAIQEKNYLLLNNVIKQNQSEISSVLANFVTDFLTSDRFQKSDFFGIITRYFKTFEPLFKSFDLESTFSKVFSDQQLNSLLPFLDQLLNEDRFTDQTVGDLLHHLPEQEISKSIEGFLTSNVLPLVQQLLTPKTIRKVSQQLDKILNQFSASPVNSLLTEKSIKNIQNRIFGLILNVFKNPNQRQYILEYIKSKIENELNPDKKLNDLLDGKVIDFLFQNIDRATQFFVNLALRFFKKNQHKIATNIYEMLMAKSDFLARQAIRFSKDDLFKAIYDIFQTKLPEFVRTHEISLEEIVRQQLRSVGNTKIGNIGAVLDHDKITKFIDLCLLNRMLIGDAKRLIHAFTRHLFLHDIDYFLKLIHLETFQKIVDLFDSEITIFLENIKKNVTERQTEISQTVASFASAIMVEMIQTVTIKDIRLSMTVSEYQKSMLAFLSFIIEQAIQFKLPGRFTEEFLKISRVTSLDQILDKKQLNRSFTDVFNFMLENQELRTQLQDDLSRLTEELLDQFNDIVHEETRQDILHIALNGLMATFKANLLHILDTIRFKKIVMDQISKMHPARIEKMFNKFAGSYFPKLINYGFGFGFVFGLSMDLFYYFVVLLLK